MNKNIKLFDKKNIKPVLMYLLMILLYIFLWRSFGRGKGEAILQIIGNIIFFIIGHLFPTEDSEYFLLGTLELMGIIIFYLFAKICGLFKRLEGVNFFLSLVIIILVDIILLYSICTTIQLNPLKFSYEFMSLKEYFYPTTIMFFIYKFFHFLGEKFPSTFGKIGYWTSIEFYRELFVRVKKNFRWY